ncbi:anaerobic ribonucleoside-triphosphate reductase activating protein [Jeongeupia chitinilytica]|uniref:Anaerobic ribonucleoside-triphosphate reductase activating protein n=1 Tax=Jeongeupia chitinilytica TaxID=1041641 RepID=A0ABQ3H2F0_9NEIS|nr:anaerobic ribonucleoside-triphosphate reductase activating protein [Jeongeupia chitinilytica]GHD64184.1 anaerobic ribonucleoside-triphosphate reductase activating protein [Jeongeupia chitinilytica]
MADAATVAPHSRDLPNPPKIGGFVPFSSCDYPGQLACVVFLSGCPWRCHYCHNPHLQKRGQVDGVPVWAEIIAWLEQRRGLLDAVVFCGGEPLAEKHLPAMLRDVKAMGFKAALHTGGAYPVRLAHCLPYLDWVGFDVKTGFAGYADVTLVPRSGDPALASLQQVIGSGVAFECRTTIHPQLHDEAALLALGDTLAGLGVQDYALQRFRPQGTASALLGSQPLPAGYPSNATTQALAAKFARFSVRND